MTRADRDAEFTEYVTARLPSLRRVAYLLYADWPQADDVDAYARAVLVREFLGERRSGWARRVRRAAAGDPAAR